jgi:hypothetical protein
MSGGSPRKGAVSTPPLEFLHLEALKARSIPAQAEGLGSGFVSSKVEAPKGRAKPCMTQSNHR